MRVVIVYGSKYGATRKVAERMNVLYDGESSVVDFYDLPNLNLTGVSHLILGSSYRLMNKNRYFHKHVHTVIENLKNVQIGLFVLGIDNGSSDQKIKDVFGEDLYRLAFTFKVFESRIPTALNWKDRQYYRLKKKEFQNFTGDALSVSDEEINQFLVSLGL